MAWIVYVDMDAFYLSCELVRHPELRGRPAIVAHDPKEGKGRGVVLSASYEARALGFRSAMPVKQAWQMREMVAWLPPDFEYYETTSQRVFELLRSRSELVRAFSIDEAAYPLADASEEEAKHEGESVRHELRERLGLPSSIGVAMDLSIAKVASDKAKPGGVKVLPPGETAAFLAPLPVRALPGIGPVTAYALRSEGVERVEDLTRVPLARLRKALGPGAERLVALARGQPPPEAWPEETPPRSFGTMITFDTDLGDEPALRTHLDGMVTTVADRAAHAFQEGRTVTVRVRWEDLSSTQKSRTLPHPTGHRETLLRCTQELLHQLLAGPERGEKAVRTLGVTLQDLRPANPAQRTLDLVA